MTVTFQDPLRPCSPYLGEQRHLPLQGDCTAYLAQHPDEGVAQRSGRQVGVFNGTTFSQYSAWSVHLYYTAPSSPSTGRYAANPPCKDQALQMIFVRENPRQLSIQNSLRVLAGTGKIGAIE